MEADSDLRNIAELLFVDLRGLSERLGLLPPAIEALRTSLTAQARWRS